MVTDRQRDDRNVIHDEFGNPPGAPNPLPPPQEDFDILS